MRFIVAILPVILLHSLVLAADRLPVIDVHLHVYGDRQLPMPEHPAYPGQIKSVPDQRTLIRETLAQMDEHNVVLGLLHDQPANIERLRTRDPERFQAFPRIGGRFHDGGTEHDPTTQEFEVEFQKGNWAGIGEVATVYNGLHPTDERLWPYYEIAHRNDVPIFWHSGTRPRMTRTQPQFRAEIGRPTHWEDVLAKHQDLSAVLFHAGHPFRDDMIAVMMTYPSVHTDTGPLDHVRTSEQFYAYYGFLIEMGMGKRILFGSDQMGWPEGIGHAIDVIKNAPWTEQVKRDILYNNAARFLRLSEKQIAAHHR